MDKYSYYVTYKFKGEKDDAHSSGDVGSHIIRGSKITSFKDLDKLANYIALENGFHKVIITFFHLFDEIDYPGHKGN